MSLTPRRSWVITLVAMLVAAGCGLSHQQGEDGGGGSDGDAGPISEDASLLPEVGPIPCDRGSFCSCEVGRGDCSHLPGTTCIRELGVCLPLWYHDIGGQGTDGAALSDLARLEGSTATQRYCWSERIALAHDEPYEERQRIAGFCVDPWVCDEAEPSGLAARCRYSDGTEWVDGPPDEGACPPAPGRSTAFCGGACGACPHVEAPGATQCLGRSEDRGFGLCAFGGGTVCSEGSYADVPPGTCEHFFGEPCACVRLRGSDGELREWGHDTVVSGCLAYRARYPGAVECMEPFEWTVLP